MTEKPRTFNGDLANLPQALLPLTQEPRWLVWRWEERRAGNGSLKWTKPPYQAWRPREPAKSNTPSTWGAYRDAVAAVEAKEADGIGFALCDSNIGAGDLDHCRDIESGAVASWADNLNVEANGAYREITVSGTGTRLLGMVVGAPVHRKFTFNRKTGAGVELYRKAARYITVSGLEIGNCPELPPIDDFIDVVYARHAGKTRQPIDYDDLIRNGAPEGRRSEVFHAVVWHLAGKGLGAEDITDELAEHPNGIGQKYAGRLYAEVCRSFEKWREQTQTHATGGTAGAWPQITIRGGELPRVVNEAEAALLSLGREIYQYSDFVVRPVLSELKAAKGRLTRSWRLVPVTPVWLVEALTCAARFLKYNRQTKTFVAANAPYEVAETYLSRQGAWNLPLLSGIATTPFLRDDGSLCSVPGYDAVSGILLKTDGQDFPAIPAAPGKAEAQAALGVLKEIIKTFPFCTETDRAVALSAILTVLDRRAMQTVPLHAFTAPSPGTGKSLLVDVVSIIASGRLMPVLAQGANEEEFEKRLSGELVAGAPVIAIDNCSRPVQSVFLNQVLTQHVVKPRILGKTGNPETLVSCTIFATGNNLTVVGDLTRRTIICAMDAQCERPEMRIFSDDILERARAKRGEIVAAALTVLLAWHCSREETKSQILGSFEDWSRRICGPLVWLDCFDPCSSVEKARDDDPERDALLAVLGQWQLKLGVDRAYTGQQIIEQATNALDFYNALIAVARNRAGFVDNVRLGYWLKRVEGKIINNLKVVRYGIRDGYRLWKLIRLS